VVFVVLSGRSGDRKGPALLQVPLSTALGLHLPSMLYLCTCFLLGKLVIDVVLIPTVDILVQLCFDCSDPTGQP
jgi:hypothetical protein